MPMIKSLWNREGKMKQSRKLQLISEAASQIRKLYEKGEITEKEASSKLFALRADPEGALKELKVRVELSAA